MQREIVITRPTSRDLERVELSQNASKTFLNPGAKTDRVGQI